MKIAIVHDYFIQMGGAEKVAEELHAIFPSSSMVATVDIRPNSKTKTSWMRHLPISERNHRLFFMLFPLAVETLDLTEYDLIISSSSGYAKGIRKRKDAVHICYCHTPMRWVWRYETYAERESFGPMTRGILPLLLSLLKKWDLAAAKRPDYYIANSRVVSERIKAVYGRESAVIPPIDTTRFAGEKPGEDFYLILSRLAPYKRLDLAVEACKRMDRRLIVLGDGPARAQLESLAGPKTQFLGRQSDDVVADYSRRCRALIFPGEEDFGMTPIEINAAGRPVIAFRAGGTTETVVEGKTGLFFEQQTPESLIEAIRNFEFMSWDPQEIVKHSMLFSREVFASSIMQFVHSVVPAAASQTAKTSHRRPAVLLANTTSVVSEP